MLYRVIFKPDEFTEKPVVNIYPEQRFQEILGFGGSFTETSAYNFSRMSEDRQRDILDAYFSREKGLGYNFCRTHIHSCDFSLNEYTYVDEGDAALRTFSIERDRKYILPFLKAALVRKAQDTDEEIYLFASPWSPPAWMKDNNDFCHGGKLLSQYSASWGAYMAKYFTEYRKEGVKFFGLSVQNEPNACQTWESCLFTAEEEARFVRDYLKPSLSRAGFDDLRVMIWDHNKERVYDRARDIFALTGVAKDIWGIAFHWYSGDHFDALEMTHRAFPDKPLILSEFCLGGERGEAAAGPHSSWDGLEIYAHELIGDLNHFCAAAVDWNMIVDETGGPFHNRPKGCKARLVANTQDDTFTLEPTYYCMAHFSKFIARGAVRIGSSSFGSTCRVTAFQNPNGSIVLVALCAADKDMEIYLRLNGETAATILPSHSLTTFVIS